MNGDLSKSKTTEAKYDLILRGSMVLNDNPFRLFVLLVLIHSNNVTLLICDHSGVQEFPAITDITKGDGLT